jgi:hypothetical protein
MMVAADKVWVIRELNKNLIRLFAGRRIGWQFFWVDLPGIKYKSMTGA